MTMSNENERHPSALTDDEKAAMKEKFPHAFDADGEVEAGEEGAGAAPAAAAPAAGADGKDPPAAGKEAPAAGADGAAPAAAAADAAGADGAPAGAEGAAPGTAPAAGADKDDAPVSRKEFNGVLNELLKTREKLKQSNAEAPPVRDFEGELKQLDTKLEADQQALADKYDQGDMDAAELIREQSRLLREYQTSVRTITVAESQHVAATTIQKEKDAAAAQSVQQAWDTAIGSWKESNADFLANPIRRNAVAGLLEQFGADESLTNEQVIAEVEKAAFEAFNWKPAAGGAPAAAANPHAARDAADRQAAARASAATPPTLDGGVGGRGAPGGVDLQNLKPGQFSKLPRAEQEKLLGEGAL
jgi:hypothetical protein